MPRKYKSSFSRRHSLDPKAEYERLAAQKEKLQQEIAAVKGERHRLEFRFRFLKLGGREVRDRDRVWASDLLYEALGASAWDSKHFDTLIEANKNEFAYFFAHKGASGTDPKDASLERSWEEFALSCGLKNP